MRWVIFLPPLHAGGMVKEDEARVTRFMVRTAKIIDQACEACKRFGDECALEFIPLRKKMQEEKRTKNDPR
jgi:hypothetical protein